MYEDADKEVALPSIKERLHAFKKKEQKKL